MALALLLSFGIVWGSIGAMQQNFILQQKVDALNEDNSMIELTNDGQRLQNKYYASNEYLELSARSHLGKVMPGEKLLILPKNTISSPPDKIDVFAAQATANRSNFEQWIYFLFGQKS